MHPADTEGPLDRALKQLPVLRAPDTLLPRVSAAVHAWVRRPWYERAWFTWPLALRGAGVAVLGLLLVGVAIAAPGLSAEAQALAGELATRLLQRAPVSLLRFEASASALLGAWQALSALVLGYAAAVVFVLGLMSAMCVAALNRVAMREPMLP